MCCKGSASVMPRRSAASASRRGPASRTYRATVSSATQEAEMRQRYPPDRWSVSRKPLGPTEILLTFTRKG